jgi:hypothetical protein
MMCGELGSEMPFGNLLADQVIKDSQQRHTTMLYVIHQVEQEVLVLKPGAVAKYHITSPKYQSEGNERDGTTISNKTLVIPTYEQRKLKKMATM